mmetsp:Transcript_1622/g.3021  ORF Transcript_1622/g.3021 Transcript_1622/m.3021 type:complete len:97 (-) Transcript_1622:255-545(-)
MMMKTRLNSDGIFHVACRCAVSHFVPNRCLRKCLDLSPVGGDSEGEVQYLDECVTKGANFGFVGIVFDFLGCSMSDHPWEQSTSAITDLRTERICL